MNELFKLQGLRTKIIAWSFFPTLVILATVALVTYLAYQNVTDDLVLAKDEELTRLSASQLSSEMRAYTELLTEIASTSDLRQTDLALQNAALQRFSNRLVVFDGGVVILDNFGVLVAALPERPGDLRQDWSNREYFRQIVHTSRPVFSDILPDGPQQADVIVAAVPILGDQGELLGFLAGMFRTGVREVSSFYGGIVKQRIAENGNAYIVDSRGNVIYHQDLAQIGSNLSTNKVVQAAMEGDSGSVRTMDANGRRIVAGYAAIPGTPWFLVTEENWVSLASAFRGYSQFLVLLMGLGVLVPILLVNIGIRQIMQPIVALTSAAQEVARGNFDQTITAQTNDEIAELANQFNDMAARLRASYTDLEQRVSDRTKELAVLYRADEELLSHLELDSLLKALVEVAVNILKTDKSALLVWDAGKNKLVVGADSGFRSEAFKSMAFGIEDGIIGSVMSTGEPAVVEDVSKEVHVAVAVTAPEGIQSFMHVPIKVKGQMFGVFNFNYLTPRAFSEDERRLFIALAQRAAMAIENAQLYEQAQFAATVEERQRLARELHDAVTQTLFSSSLIADVLPRIWERNPDEGRRRLEELRQLTRGALAEMRTLLLELRPAALVEVELNDLLRQLGEAFTGRSRIPIQVEVDADLQIPPDVKVGLYRIAQEALNNIAKHASASQVTLLVRSQAKGLSLSIEDNGVGFNPAGISSEHLGLKIMNERSKEIGADLTIESQIGSGTKIVAGWEPKRESIPGQQGQ
jgi:nitrate/nitrite-specific signal transduction histidine kinase